MMGLAVSDQREEEPMAVQPVRVASAMLQAMLLVDVQSKYSPLKLAFACILSLCQELFPSALINRS